MNSGSKTIQRDAAALNLDPAAGARLVDFGQTATSGAPCKRIAPSLLRFLYWIYERRLLHQLQQGSLPRHVGIIFGNRRHARRRGLGDPREIYQCGADKLDDILDLCAELGITAVTLWVFSTDNLKRPPAEVSGILAAIEAKLTALAHDPFMHQNASAYGPSAGSIFYRNQLLLRSAQRKWQPHSMIYRP